MALTRISALDTYEGINDPTFEYYKKKEAFIQVNTTQIKALVYHFKKCPNAFKRIQNGDYSKYLDNI